MNTTKEKIKNVLICVLLIGMVYMTYSVWFFDSPFGDASLSELFNLSENDSIIYEGEGSDIESFGIRPLGIVLRDGGGSRGAVYESGASDELYKNLRDEIASSLGSVGSRKTVSEDEWEEALLGNGIFLDYHGDIPVEALKLWIGAESGGDSLCGRYFMLSTDDENAKIYIKNSESGTIYLMESGAASEEINSEIAKLVAKPASFALERSEDDFLAVSPETVIVENRTKPLEISAYNAYSSFKSSVTDACLESFRLRDAAPSTYSEQDGTEVYIADMVTLKISPDGIASYSDTRESVDETLGIGVEFDGEVPTLAEMTESARALAASIADKLPGNGGIYLAAVEQNGDRTEFVFGRTVDGIPVDMMGTVYFVRISISGASVRAASVNLRGYEVTAKSADILSERLAAAAVSGSGKSGDLNLRYFDDGSTTLSPSWFIGGIKKDTEEDESGLVEG